MEETIGHTSRDGKALARRARELQSLLSVSCANGHACDVSAIVSSADANKPDSAKMADFLECVIDTVKKAGVDAPARSAATSKREKMLLAAMFSHLGEGMIVVSDSRRVLIANESAMKLLGFSKDDKVHGRSYSNLLVLQDRQNAPIPEEKDPVRLAFESGQPVRITLMDDFYCVRADGKSFPVSMSASPIVADGKTLGVAVMFDDITKEKKVDEIKSDFIYIASHQLRTPLTVSTLHTEMLLGGHAGEVSKEQRELLSEIHFYNKKMAQLLSVFMTVSKIEMGTFTMQEKPTDLSSLIDDVLHELNTQIKSKSLEVKREYGDMPAMYADPEFIRIVFQNLISNAVKYTPHEGRIYLAVKMIGDNEASVVIEDTGCGIPQSEQSQVFTKLYRGTNTKSHRWDSNGLGLYITKSIVDKCRGKISFRSEEGKGTTFYVNLPLRQKSPAPLEQHASVA